MEYREYVDRIVKEAQNLANIAKDMTLEQVDKAKTKVDIKKAELERDKAYKALGRIMYQIEIGTLTRDDAIIKAACDQVKEQEDLIEALKNKAMAKAEKAAEEPKEEECCCKEEEEKCCCEEAPEEEKKECCCEEAKENKVEEIKEEVKEAAMKVAGEAKEIAEKVVEEVKEVVEKVTAKDEAKEEAAEEKPEE